MKCKLGEEFSLSRPLDAHEGMDVEQAVWHSFASLNPLLSCGKDSLSAKALYWAWISPIKIQ